MGSLCHTRHLKKKVKVILMSSGCTPAPSDESTNKQSPRETIFFFLFFFFFGKITPEPFKRSQGWLPI